MTASNLEPPELKQYTGAQRAAALMLALGQDNGAPIWTQLAPDEVVELSAAIAQLGSVPVVVIEHLLDKFSTEVSTMSALYGSYESVDRLLQGLLPSKKVAEILKDIRGSGRNRGSGKNLWENLANVSEKVLAGYLKNEYPQTGALIISRLRPDYSAKVLAELPSDFATDIIMRMLRMDTVQSDVLTDVEQNLRAEFITNLSRSVNSDPHQAVAVLFNALDRQTEEKLLKALDEKVPDSAERIRSLMFTFDDLANLLPGSVSTLVRFADKREMALALKAADEPMRQMFFGAMTQRAAKMMQDDMRAMGPVRVSECEEAQMSLVRLTKSLAERNEIVMPGPKDDEAMIV